VSSLDIVPTVLEAAGVSLPDRDLDGISLFDELCSSSFQGVRQRTLFWHFRNEFAVRENDWKLVQTRERPGGIRLYNLARDPAELKDLAKEQPAIYGHLVDLYENWRSSMAGEVKTREGAL
jgi:arylsulfatase A-like enzyme